MFTWKLILFVSLSLITFVVLMSASSDTNIVIPTFFHQCLRVLCFPPLLITYACIFKISASICWVLLFNSVVLPSLNWCVQTICICYNLRNIFGLKTYLQGSLIVSLAVSSILKYTDEPVENVFICVHFYYFHDSYSSTSAQMTHVVWLLCIFLVTALNILQLFKILSAQQLSL